jgi:hypothetical protein
LGAEPTEKSETAFNASAAFATPDARERKVRAQHTGHKITSYSEKNPLSA